MKQVDDVRNSIYIAAIDATKAMLTVLAQDEALALIKKGFADTLSQIDQSKGVWNWLTRESARMWVKRAQKNVNGQVTSLSESLSEKIGEKGTLSKIMNVVHAHAGKQITDLLTPRISTKATAGMPYFSLQRRHR